MASSKRQEEKNMKILRDLVKKPENKRCFECDSLGPTYVNLFNNTFVCVNCSGVLRGFEHRLKSISMATFKDEEIAALQRDGNDVGRAVWLGRWNAREEQMPDGKDPNRLKEFIRLKYQAKKWYVPREHAQVAVRDEPGVQPAQNLFGAQQLPRLVVEPGVAAQGRPASNSFNGNAPASNNNGDIFGAIAGQKPAADFFGGGAPASNDFFGGAPQQQQQQQRADDWTQQPLPVGPQKLPVSSAVAPAQPAPAQQKAAPKNDFDSFVAEVSRPQTQEDKYTAIKDLLGAVSFNSAPAQPPQQQQQGWGAAPQPQAQPQQQQGWGAAPQPQAQPQQQQGW
eukprot:Opistho-2@47907